MILPEVAQVPVALVLHEADHLLVWRGGHEGAAYSCQKPGQGREGAGEGGDPGLSPEK